MGSQSNDSLEAKINAMGLVVGNQVLGSDRNPTTASRQNWVDSDSRLAAGIQQPFALGAAQSTITGPVFILSGKATSGILINTLVLGSDVTTATKAAFLRVDVTDDNSVVTAGSYYLELFTIT